MCKCPLNVYLRSLAFLSLSLSLLNTVRCSPLKLAIERKLCSLTFDTHSCIHKLLLTLLLTRSVCALLTYQNDPTSLHIQFEHIFHQELLNYDVVICNLFLATVTFPPSLSLSLPANAIPVFIFFSLSPLSSSKKKKQENNKMKNTSHIA